MDIKRIIVETLEGFQDGNLASVACREKIAGRVSEHINSEEGLLMITTATLEQINEVISQYYTGRISNTGIIVRNNGELSIRTRIDNSPVYLSFMPDGCREKIYRMLNKEKK